MYVVGSTKYYVHQNHLFSVSAVTDAAGSTRERYSYTSYGDRAVRTPAGAPLAKSQVNNGIGFTGYSVDCESLNNFARARLFVPRIGSFSSRDPWRFNNSIPYSRDGYHDGYSLYRGYFVPLGVDPSGMGMNQWSCCNGVSYWPGSHCCIDGKVVKKAESGLEVAGIKVRRFAGPGGHQWLVISGGVPYQNPSDVHVGVNKNPDPDGGNAVWVNELSNRDRSVLENSSNYYEWTIETEGGCCNKSTGEIYQCILSKIQNEFNSGAPDPFNIASNNCRDNSERILSECCARKGKMTNNPTGLPGILRGTLDWVAGPFIYGSGS
jgi:hypothetical protein